MNENITVLVIEDDKSISRFLQLSLKTNNYKPLLASNGLDGISLFMSNNPDIILLDLGLPDIDGREVLEQIRNQSDVPIIIVSARGEEKEKVEALDNGADDYITKPFHLGELLARIRVALRKKTTGSTLEKVFELDGFKLDFEKRRITINNEEVHFTPIEYKLLTLLVRNAGKVLTHNFIIKKIWGYSYEEESQSLRVFMANIRRKIETDTMNPRYIITEVGVGYRFMDE